MTDQSPSHPPERTGAESEPLVPPPHPSPAAPPPPPPPPAAIPAAINSPVTGTPAPVPPPRLASPASASRPEDDRSGPAALAAERPEIAVGAAFGGGLVLALILKRLAR